MSEDANRGDEVGRRGGPTDPRRPGGPSRPGRGLRLGFGPRLALALGLTLVLVLGVGYVEMARVLEDRVIRPEAVYQGAQADALETIAAGETPKRAMREIALAVDNAAKRAGTQETLLIDSRFMIGMRTTSGSSGPVTGTRGSAPRFATGASMRAGRRIEAAIRATSSS